VTPDRSAVVELDQLTDGGVHLFIGIGVIWTAVGMRSALQVALADPEHALAGSAGPMLKKLPGGGLPVAASPTTVGAAGGDVRRRAKTLSVGAALHEYYERLQHRDMRELLATVQRLERALEPGGNGESGRAST